ncbi:MAG TPA: hypothetical protein PKY05_11060, partial [Fibrobacteria bacterium]|nr:hypothetical protein [Fibrobacteria bacterium]
MNRPFLLLTTFFGCVAGAFAQAPDSVAAASRVREVPLVVRSQAPVGSQVTLEGEVARMDSTG